MGKKLYESNTIRSVANALRNKIKEYYTFTGSGEVDTDGTIINFDGANSTGGESTKGSKVKDGKAKYPSMTTPSGNGFWYEYDYMLKELAPMPNDGRWPVPGDNFDQISPRYNKTQSGFFEKDLGILYLNTRLGFPEASTSKRIDIISKLTATGAKYIVPDNGWIYVYTKAKNAGRRLQITNLTSKMIVQGQSGINATRKNTTAHITDNVKVTNVNQITDIIYVAMPCARYDEVQVDYKKVTLSVDASLEVTEGETNGTMAELYAYFIPAKKTNYDETYTDPKSDTAITENNQFTLGKNKPFEVSLSGSSYKALNDGWFYATSTVLGAAKITLNCTSNGMIATSSETNLTIDKGSKKEQASDPSKGPGKEAIVEVKSYPYCFMPLAKGATISVSGGANKYYFLNAV